MEMLVPGERTGAEDRESKHRARGRNRVERKRAERGRETRKGLAIARAYVR